MLLYALDELFFIFDQVKWQQGIDERLVVAYEILSHGAAMHRVMRWVREAWHARCPVPAEYK